jgi:hypothetical protein
MKTKKNNVHCDYHGKCKLPAYAKVYFKDKSSWSHLCQKHLKQEKKKGHLKLWLIIDREWIFDQFLLAAERVEKKYDMCNGNECLVVMFQKEIGDLADKMFKLIEKHRKPHRVHSRSKTPKKTS